MAQTRCQIWSHTIKLITPTAAHRAPRDCCRTAKGLRKACPNSVLITRGTEGSNLLSSSGESGTNCTATTHLRAEAAWAYTRARELAELRDDARQLARRFARLGPDSAGFLGADQEAGVVWQIIPATDLAGHRGAPKAACRIWALTPQADRARARAASRCRGRGREPAGQ
jgi:hypothetical protein